MNLRLLSFTSLAIALSGPALAAGSDWPQWRGAQRDGLSTETGLLREWPAGGPKLIWQVKDLGGGYSTPAIAAGRLYVMANKGLDDESVRAFSTQDGHEIWSTRVGKVGNPKQDPNFPGSRSTPTVDGDTLYALSSDGDLVSLETGSGKLRWQKNLRTDFDGKPGEWAYAESPLIDGDTLVVAPGGPTATVLALNKKTGATLWKCATPEADEAGFASAVVVEVGGVRQYVQFLRKGLVGIDAKTGKLLWRHAQTVSKYGANIPTPVAAGDLLFSAGAGTGGGTVRLLAKNGGIQPEPVYFSPKLPTAIGGAVKVGEWLFGTTAQAMVCVTFATGEPKWEERALGAASLCVADGRIYLHAENGDVALVEVSGEGYHEKGRFTPPELPKRSSDMEKAWAYPVVAQGRLYVRDLNSLWCYDVRNAAAKP